MAEIREINNQCKTLDQVIKSNDFFRGVEKIANRAGYDEESSQRIRGYFERGIENLSEEEIGEVILFIGKSEVLEKTKVLLEKLLNGIKLGDSQISEEELNSFMKDFLKNGGDKLIEEIRGKVKGVLKDNESKLGKKSTEKPETEISI